MFKAIKERIWPAPPPASKPVIFDDQDGRPVARYCEYNQAKLGFVGNWWHFQGYVKFLRVLGYRTALESIWYLIQYTLVIILLPIAPFFRAAGTMRDARTNVWDHLLRRACGQCHAHGSSLTYEMMMTKEWKYDQRAHVYYHPADTDLPDSTCNKHGELVYAVCRVCGQAEGELEAECPNYDGKAPR